MSASNRMVLTAPDLWVVEGMFDERLRWEPTVGDTPTTALQKVREHG